MGLSDGRKSFRIGLAVLIQYRSVTDTQPASHVAVAITLYAKASSPKRLVTDKRCLCLTCAVKTVTSESRIAGTVEAVRYISTSGKITAASVVLGAFIHIYVSK